MASSTASKSPSLLRSIWRRIDKFFSVDVNPETVVLADFSKQRDRDRWRVFSDSAFGGTSTANLQASPDGKHAVLSGRYSKAVKENSQLVRSGFVGCNMMLPRKTNLSLHDFLEFRVRSEDGHTYVASVRTDQYTGGDEEAWQAPLKPSRPGEWEDVRVPLDDFVFTFRGRLVQQQKAFARMPRHNVIAVGVSLSASKEMADAGDFKLELAKVSAGAEQLEGEAAQIKAWRGMLDEDAALQGLKEAQETRQAAAATRVRGSGAQGAGTSAGAGGSEPGAGHGSRQVGQAQGQAQGDGAEAGQAGKGGQGSASAQGGGGPGAGRS